MTDFKIVAYEKVNGEVPVVKFLENVNPKMRAKIYGLLEILQEKGNRLREPYSKHLEDGIFELRCKFGNDITRILYFFYYEGRIVMTNGFVKKTQWKETVKIQSSGFNRGGRKHEKNFIKLLWIVRDCGIFVLYGSSCFFSYGISGV